MKNFIYALTILMIIIVNIFNIINYQNEYYYNLIMANREFEYEFSILEGSSPEHLDFLKQSCDENNVNIIRQTSIYDRIFTTTDYIYITNDTKYNNDYTKSQYKSSIFSNDVFYIKNIEEVLTEYSYSGRYRAESNTKIDFDKFVDRYVELVNINSSYQRNQDEIISFDSESSQPNLIYYDINSIIFIFSIIFILIYLFYLITRAKEISILKINGLSNCTIIKKIILTTSIKMQSAVSSAFLLFAITISFEFFMDTMLLNIISNIIIFCIILLFSNLYIQKINIIKGLKNGANYNLIIAINILIKFIISLTILLIATNTINETINLHLRLKSFSEWEIASNYGTFTPVRVGEDEQAIQSGEYPLDIPTYEFYKSLETQMDIVYVNSRNFMLEENRKNEYLPLVVNANYLDNFPVYSVNGEVVITDETSCNAIYLVPEKYKFDNEYLEEIWLYDRNQFYNLHTQLYNQPENLQLNDIQIIYIADEQSAFTFNNKIYQQNSNKVENVVFKVITTNNMLIPDINFASSTTNSLFIPLIDMSTQTTYATMYDMLKTYKLDDNFPYFIKIDDIILNEIAQLKKEVQNHLLILILFLLIFSIAIYQCLYIVFKRYCYEFFIKKCNGYDFYGKYNKIIFVYLILNIIELLLSINLIDMSVLFVFSIKAVLELVFMVIVINNLERKNNIAILKGDR